VTDQPPILRRRTQLDRTNPTTRLLLAVVLSVPLIITLDWVSASVAVAAEFLAFLACGYAPWFLVRRLLPLLVIAPLGAINMALYGQAGGRTWWQWGPVHVSDNSLLLALALFIRVFALALPAIILFSTVDPTDMADGLAQVLRLPPRFVLGTLAGIRMIALFADDWRTLGHARRARGLEDVGRFRRWATMSFALLVFALRRGTRLATAMEARGFGASGADVPARTWARPSHMGWPDVIALAVAVTIGVLAVLAAVWQGTFWPVWR